MNRLARMGLDIAKRWFQVQAVAGDGREILNRKLPRDKVLSFWPRFRLAMSPWRPAPHHTTGAVRSEVWAIGYT
jgi:hypothetical protein